MKKRIINSAVFFTILYWLVVYVLQRKSHFLTAAPLPTWLLLVGGSLLLILLARILLPVFELVLKVTAKIGSLVFALITVLVFFILLTPISWVLKLTGMKFVQKGFDPAARTYYQPWQHSDDIGKQF
jgi:hypothetical protein